jgi:hypothetical protein
LGKKNFSYVNISTCYPEQKTSTSIKLVIFEAQKQSPMKKKKKEHHMEKHSSRRKRKKRKCFSGVFLGRIGDFYRSIR